MAIADSNEDTLWLVQPPDDHQAEVARARQLATRYRREFVDMDEFRIDQELFRSIPADLMLRYGFVPLRREGPPWSSSSPTPPTCRSSTSCRPSCGRRSRSPSARRLRFSRFLKKSESLQRVLEDAVDGFQLQVLKDEEMGEESLTVERLTTGDMNPIIRLVDSTIYTAIQRRASDIHIETGDDAVGSTPPPDRRRAAAGDAADFAAVP